MSLEKKIAELTVAINTLTETILKSDIGLLIKEQAEQIDKAVKDTIEAQQKEPVKKAKSEEQSQNKPEAETTENQPTVEQIKSYCMKLVREDGTKKQPIRDALAEYGAKTVDKVPSDKLGELMSKLEAL